MVAAVGTIANKGVYVQPRVVKQIIDSKTGNVTDIETKTKGRVISTTTAENVLSMMETVVAQGTGKNARVKGYSIGGKTGTSEDGVDTNKYVTSFIGTASISDPEVVILITLYNPTGEGGHQGGAWMVLTTHDKTNEKFEVNKTLSQEKIMKYIKKTENPYILRVGNMVVEIEYSNVKKTFNECIINILRQKLRN